MAQHLRTDLQTKLEAISGVSKVYFQPPESVKLIYPCIIYEYAPPDRLFANNLPYRDIQRYTVTVIDRNPDSSIPGELGKFPMSRLSRIFTNENLYHFVYDLYF